MEEPLQMCASKWYNASYIHMRIQLAVGTKHEAVASNFLLLVPLLIGSPSEARHGVLATCFDILEKG